MSQPSSNTFFYTNEQGNDIIVKETLFQGDMQQSANNQTSYNDLKRLMDKDKRLELHAITLSDYWRKEMIPRGLRINKFPSFGKDNLTFKKKWEAILNKCSLDLMLLLIDEAKTQRTDLRHQIETAKQEVFSSIANEHEADTLQTKLRETINELSNNLKRIKLEKFKRDEQDYKDETVYSWHKQSSRGPSRRARSVSFHLPSSATTSEDEAAQDPPETTFLGTSTEPSSARGRRGGGERGGIRTMDYQLRPRQRPQQHRAQRMRR